MEMDEIKELVKLYNFSPPHGQDLDYFFNYSFNKLESRRLSCFGMNVINYKSGNSTQYFPLASVEDVKSAYDFCETVYPNFNKGMMFLPGIFGIPGNLVAFLTVMTMRKSPGSFYVALLAMTDLLAISLKTTMMSMSHLNVQLTDTMCRVEMVISNFLVIYSSWVLVMISLERFITVWFPLKKSLYFPKSRAIKLSVIVGLIILAMCVPLLHVYIASKNKCIVSADIMRKNHAFDIYFMIFIRSNVPYCVLPAILLILFMILIAVRFRKVQYERCSLHGSDRTKDELSMEILKENSTSHASRINRHLQERVRQERAITLMLLAAALFFLLMTSPFMIIVWAYPPETIELLGPMEYAHYSFAKAFAQHLLIFNHAFNFYIYFLSSAKFRSQIKRLLLCKKRSSRSVCRTDPTMSYT